MIRLIPLLVLVFACGPSKTEQRHQRELTEAKDRGRIEMNRLTRSLNQGRFDIEEYSKIENGMLCEDVDARLGNSGREISTRTEGGVTTLVRKWSGPAGSITVTFTDGKVTSKSKNEGERED